MLVDDHPALREPAVVEHRVHGELAQSALVRRVYEDDVELALPRAQHSRKIGCYDAEIALYAFEIFLDERNGRGALVHKDDLIRAAGKALYAERAAAREKVEHPRALHLPLQDVEDGLLDPVRGGADAVVRGGQEFLASVSACDDSHSSPPNSFDTATFCAVKISFSVTRMSRGMSCGSVTMSLAPRQENATPTLTQSGKRERNLS